MSEIIAALLGVLAGGFLQAVVNFRQRRHEAESILVGIAAEVDSVCRLIRVQSYRATVHEVLGQLQSENPEAMTMVVDIGANYFSVFEALSGQIGRLEPKQVLKIVNFYAFCKAAIDSTRPDGIMSDEDRISVLLENAQNIDLLLDAILRLGDEIVQLPRTPIHSELPVR